MKKSNVKFLLAVVSAISLIPQYFANAVCPVCTLAVGVGLGVTRELGIDDTVSGLWIGAVMVSLTMWTVNWMKKKNYDFKGRWLAVFLIYILITIVPLYFIKGVWHPLNVITLFGIDINRLVMGMVLGALAFFGTGKLYDYLKAKNNGRAYFPFQKVVMPVVSLLILSVIFYFITK